MPLSEREANREPTLSPSAVVGKGGFKRKPYRGRFAAGVVAGACGDGVMGWDDS